ncbi:MAG: 6,7-dimethyl-8-ribityllumazine synthase [Candidatus Micrarchaeota archaeon]|nr:6,7-dimethyl-8-ribityllumazine synthase [Candidatus Micrarchaeota archaeon]
MSKKESFEIGIVLAEFNYDLTDAMLKKALEHAELLNLKVTHIFRVPGSFDTPYGVKQIIDKVDGIAVLGVVLEGETEHDEVVAMHAARKLMDLSIDFNKPVSLGIIGPGASRLQAEERIEEYARRAIEAIAKLLKRSYELKNHNYPS